jgi:hypothetical protein
VPLGSVARPESPSVVVITLARRRGEQFVLAILEGGVIALQLPLECPGRPALPLASAGIVAVNTCPHAEQRSFSTS